MDFSARTNRPTQSNSAANPTAQKPTKQRRGSGNIRVISVVLLYSITILIVALVLYVALIGGRGTKQSSFVDTSKHQAVFMNGGQVYFGRISTVTEKYLTLSDIYYLQVNQQVQPGQATKPENVTLAKLGCELHGPEDQMVINQDQVLFWENLKDDGQVVKAVKEFKQKNPNGLTCTTAAPAASTTETPATRE